MTCGPFSRDPKRERGKALPFGSRLNGATLQGVPQHPHPVGDVVETALLVADLALDAQRAAVADLFQRLDECRMLTWPRPSGTSSPQVPGVVGRLASLTWTLRMSGPRISTARKRIALVVQEHVGGVEVHLQVGTFQLVERPPQQVGGFLAGLKGDGHAPRLCQGADFAERVEERLAIGVVRFGQETGVQRQVGQAEGAGAVERPGEAFEAFRTVAGLPKPPVRWMVCGVV